MSRKRRGSGGRSRRPERRRDVQRSKYVSRETNILSDTHTRSAIRGRDLRELDQLLVRPRRKPTVTRVSAWSTLGDQAGRGSSRGVVLPSRLLAREDRKEHLHCARRKEKRELVFATGHGGRNGKRRYRRDETSKMRC